jgi:hypothetical protein
MMLERQPYNNGATCVDDSRTVKPEDPITLKVEVRSLDSLFPPGSPKISFIKIDVEGYEENALRGGYELIQRDRPIIFFETWGDFPEKRAQLLEYFQLIGYKTTQWRGDDFYAVPIK